MHARRLPAPLVGLLPAACIGTVEFGGEPAGDGDDDQRSGSVLREPRDGRLGDPPRAPGGGFEGEGEGEGEGEPFPEDDRDDPTSFVFGLARVHEFAIEVPPEGIEAMRATCNGSGDWRTTCDYQRGTVRYRDEVYPDVGVRIKGGWGSFRMPDQKAGWKVKFTEFGGPDFHGLARLTFNNMVQDRAMHAELLAYHTFRAAGVPAPRVGFASLTVNGQAYGLYSIIETKDRRWLSRWFFDTAGNLYEGAYFNDFTRGNEGSFEPDVAGVPTDRSDIVSLINAIHNSSDQDYLRAMDQALEWEQFLRMAALEALIDHWDGYATPPLVNNYHFYREPSTGRFTFSPWGTDQTFRNFTDPMAMQGLIMVRCMGLEPCREQYRETLIEMTDLFAKLDLVGLSRRAVELIQPAMEADPRRPYDVGAWQARVDEVQRFVQGRAADVRARLGVGP